MVETYFSAPPKQAMDAIGNYAKLLGDDPSRLLNFAYSDATVMLQTAIDRRYALFISSE